MSSGRSTTRNMAFRGGAGEVLSEAIEVLVACRSALSRVRRGARVRSGRPTPAGSRFGPCGDPPFMGRSPAQLTGTPPMNAAVDLGHPVLPSARVKIFLPSDHKTKAEPPG